MSQFLDSISDVTKNYKVYDNWEQNQADDVAKRLYLSEKLDLPKDKVELTRAKAQSVFRASDMMDKRSEDNCADMEQTTGLISMIALLPLTIASLKIPKYIEKKAPDIAKRHPILISQVPLIALLIPSIGFILWGNAKQKEASRIGRFQARQHELKDPKNFVIYTSEQIEAAKILAKNIPDKKDKQSIFKMFAGMKQMSRDKVEYKKWLEQKVSNKDETQKILSKKFTLEQITQGEEDKEIIVNIVKDVNMSAENYSENVENAFDIINLMTFITDIPIYMATNKILSKFKNISQNTKIFAPSIACTLFTLPMMFWETHEKKQGSRVGRFVKRQEILDNPELIMAYSAEQLKLAKDIKAPKLKQGFFDKIGDNFKFFGKYLKDANAYKKYVETTVKENEKLCKALPQIEISEKQLKEAKNLQAKTFRTFDKIDEMSQRYSEDTEAATQIVKQLISSISPIVGLAGPLVLVFALQKGKIPLNKIIDVASKIAFKKDSSIRVFVNKASEIINNDKALKKDFSKIFFDKKIQEKFINNTEIQKLYIELISKNANFLDQIKKIKTTKDINVFNDQLKQDFLSKWVRNIARDIIKLSESRKLKTLEKEKADKKSSKAIDFKEELQKIKKFYNDYKTLSKSLLLGGFIPIVGITAGIPIVFASWMTNIQLKAGKIGIMKAMEEIDNPKLFVNTEN